MKCSLRSMLAAFAGAFVLASPVVAAPPDSHASAPAMTATAPPVLAAPEAHPKLVVGPGAMRAAAAMSLALYAGGPPVQLVESVPIETHLGDPGIPQARDVWVAMIRGAKRSIDVEEFYVSSWPGEPMEPVLAALGDAAKRGVHVRILLDRGMSATYPHAIDSLAALPGVEHRVIDMKRIAGGIQHSKYFLIDGEQVFVGSQNFDWRSLEHIHELGVRVRDARLAQIFGDVFAWDWDAADTTTWTEQTRAPARGGPAVTRLFPRPPAPHPTGAPLRIVQSPGDTVIVWPSYSPKGWIPDSTRWDLDAIVRLIDGARHEFVVQLLTYAPEEYGETDSTLDVALRRAAARGVQVKLLISDWEVNGKGIGWLQRLAGVPNIETKLSTIPEWSGGYIPFARVEHCKYAVADTAAVWVGTANWGPGYFYGTRNLALVMENRPLAATARRIFETGWTAPSAAAVRTDFTYPPKIRGATPPPGKKAYGS